MSVDGRAHLDHTVSHSAHFLATLLTPSVLFFNFFFFFLGGTDGLFI